ncbi:MAG TPA: hypothetical protein VK513_15340 [Terriglobales bacterium]|nr:hypothetical protein [Terriglobales bacterium]
MNRKAISTSLGAALAALAILSAVFAASAGAAPAWKFEGKSLEGTETVLGAAIDSSMTIPGLTTKCEDFLYKLTIKNEAGTGKGEVTEVPLFNCTASEVCTVKAIAAEALPWPAKLTTVSTSNYIVIEGVKVSILYAGTKCVLGGTKVVVTGSAGGLIDNPTETATFNATTLTATGTSLKALGQKIEWNGLFPTEAFEWHREQALSVS